MPITAAPKVARGRDIGRLVREPLWDTEALVESTNYAQVVFFSKPQGQTMNDGTLKSLTHTNLTQASMLGEPSQHLAMGFRVRVVKVSDGEGSALTPEVTLGFEQQIRRQGVLKFGLSGKIFYEIPLNEIPTGLGAYTFLTQAVAADAIAESWGWPQPNSFYTLRIPQRVQGLFKSSAPAYAGYQLIDSTMPITCQIAFDPVLALEASQQVDLQVQVHGIRLKVVG